MEATRLQAAGPLRHRSAPPDHRAAATPRRVRGRRDDPGPEPDRGDRLRRRPRRGRIAEGEAPTLGDGDLVGVEPTGPERRLGRDAGALDRRGALPDLEGAGRDGAPAAGPRQPRRRRDPVGGVLRQWLAEARRRGRSVPVRDRASQRADGDCLGPSPGQAARSRSNSSSTAPGCPGRASTSPRATSFERHSNSRAGPSSAPSSESTPARLSRNAERPSLSATPSSPETALERLCEPDSSERNTVAERRLRRPAGAHRVRRARRAGARG